MNGTSREAWWLGAMALATALVAGCGDAGDDLDAAPPDGLVADAPAPDAPAPDAPSDAESLDAAPPGDASCILDGGLAEGWWSVDWTLTLGGDPVTCAAAGVDTIWVVSEGDTVGNYIDIFDCDTDLPEMTAALPFDGYTVFLTAKDIDYNTIADSASQRAVLRCVDLVALDFVFPLD